MLIERSLFLTLIGCLATPLLAPPLLAQQPRPSEVELPLSVYDQLRAQAKEKKAPRSDIAPFSSVRLVKGTMSVDLTKLRATWQAELDVTAGGAEAPFVPLLQGLAATPLERSTVTPETAAVASKDGAARLEPEDGGSWRVFLSGEVGGAGTDETAGVRFALPKLLALPAAFDVTLPDGATATVSLGDVSEVRKGGARVVYDGSAGATLTVKRAMRRDLGPPVVGASLHLLDRLSDDAVRSEARLVFRVKRGLLETRTITFPGASLLAATGPVFAGAPDKDGTLTLRFEPPVREKTEVAVTLTFLSPNDAKASAFVPILPKLAVSPGERLDTRLTVVAEGGLLVEASGDEDWAPHPDLSDVRTSGEEIALSWTARDAGTPAPPKLAIRRPKALAVASALARVSLTVFVGETGETRTRLVATVRSRGRSSLRFKVSDDAVLLAARVDGATAAASRPEPGTLEVPMRSESGTTKVELLLSGRAAVPRDGVALELSAAAPDEPIERVAWTVVLPPGVTVKEEGRALPAPSDPPAPPSRPEAELTAADRAAMEATSALARTDLLAVAEGPWSPRPELPVAPAAFRTEIADAGEGVAALKLTLKTRKEKEPWF